jgi:hypothetical protein
MTPEERDTVVKFLAAKWSSPKCRLCDANEWFMEFVAIPVPGPFDVLGMGVAHIPVVVVMCKNCGNAVPILKNLAMGSEPTRVT